MAIDLQADKPIVLIDRQELDELRKGNLTPARILRILHELVHAGTVEGARGNLSEGYTVADSLALSIAYQALAAGAQSGAQQVFEAGWADRAIPTAAVKAFLDAVSTYIGPNTSREIQNKLKGETTTFTQLRKTIHDVIQPAELRAKKMQELEEYLAKAHPEASPELRRQALKEASQGLVARVTGVPSTPEVESRLRKILEAVTRSAAVWSAA